ncbi:glycosyl hydrolase 2 galactose-binding domain-containing protein [Algibacter sp. Ld11]|uniref:beta-mannosidase n=1 Tax=Algibacter sp. Ld11 TaxID=649150 RepID=UPI00386BC25C
MIKYVKLVLLLMCITACNTSPNFISKKIDSNWQFKSVKDTFWLNAKVPGSVHTDLMQHGIIENSFYRLNEKKQQWIDKNDWEYKTVFNIDNAIFDKEIIELNFKGLDTYAHIYLNDSLVLNTNNMFVGNKLDCKSLLKLGENKLKIIFDSPIKIGLEKRKELGYVLPNAVNDQSENGGLGKKQVAVFNRKAGYHFGWDWGPRLVTSGIWQDIELHAWDKAIIRDVYIKQDLISKDVALLSTEIEIHATEAFKTLVNIKIDSVLSVQKEIELTEGVNKINVPVEIKNPELWWTNGLGKQKLYQVDVELGKPRKILATHTNQIGLKTLKVVQEKDSIGESFYFKLNGHSVFMKGANYIPQDVFLNRISREDYETVVKNMVEANYNMVRVWGGGIYEKDVFYDLCDTYGILVWQDFMFACAMYPGDQTFLENVKAEAIYNVKRLRNHTSIALWCGNNENLIAWKNWGWINELLNSQGQDVVDTVWKGYQDVFHNILPEVVAELDNDTFYWASSPTSARGEDSNLASGDYHYWGVWGQQQPFSTFNEFIPRFMSEYGFQSFPEFESVKKYTIKDDWDIYSEVMKSHQRSSIGNKSIERYMKSWYKTPKDFESFLYVSQLLQAKGMKIAIEAHRRNMPYCMGSLYWQINDCWPVASWSTIDYYGKWKASHYQVKDLYKPVKSMFYENEKDLELHIVSDNLINKKGHLSIEVVNFKGAVLKTLKSDINIEANTSHIYFTEAIKTLLNHHKKDDIFIVAKLLDDKHAMFDESLFFFKPPSKLKLTQPTFNYTIIKQEENKFLLEIATDVLAKDVRFSTAIHGRFSKNYFDMVPNETYTVYFNSEEPINIEKFKEDLNIMSLVNSY